MGNVVRFGVSLGEELLVQFDSLCERQGYASRSEALRDMIRQVLAQDTLQKKDANTVGILSLIYDHNTRDLSKKLIEKQHVFHECISSSLHVHLDHNNCLEVLILKGRGESLQEVADMLRAVRGVKLGAFSFLPVEELCF